MVSHSHGKWTDTHRHTLPCGSILFPFPVVLSFLTSAKPFTSPHSFLHVSAPIFQYFIFTSLNIYDLITCKNKPFLEHFLKFFFFFLAAVFVIRSKVSETWFLFSFFLLAFLIFLWASSLSGVPVKTQKFSTMLQYLLPIFKKVHISSVFVSFLFKKSFFHDPTKFYTMQRFLRTKMQRSVFCVCKFVCFGYVLPGSSPFTYFL